MNLDHELRGALRRTEPPRDFAAGVMSRIEQPSKRWSRVARIAATFLVVSLAGFAAIRVEQERERRQGELAKQMLLTAMRITVEKATVARDAVERTSESR